ADGWKYAIRTALPLSADSFADPAAVTPPAVTSGIGRPIASGSAAATGSSGAGAGGRFPRAADSARLRTATIASRYGVSPAPLSDTYVCTRRASASTAFVP